jgi:biopolymer transport protein TolQ
MSLSLSCPVVFGYFSQSNTAGQVILVLLAVFSIVAWSVMIGKYLDLRQLQLLNRTMDRKLAQQPTLLSMKFHDQAATLGPYAQCVDAAIRAAHAHKGRSIDAVRLQVGHIENALQRSVAAGTIRYEDKMVTLGSIVTGAPFLGLLGTVWGVMDAFGSLANQSSASIQLLAPGVSGALLTTVGGLIVAIPSVFGYNFLLAMSRLAVTELENFASTLADRLELEIEQRRLDSQSAGRGAGPATGTSPDPSSTPASGPASGAPVEPLQPQTP